MRHSYLEDHGTRPPCARPIASWVSVREIQTSGLDASLAETEVTQGVFDGRAVFRRAHVLGRADAVSVRFAGSDPRCLGKEAMVAVDPLLQFLVGRAMVSSLLLDSMSGRLLLTVRAWVT